MTYWYFSTLVVGPALIVTVSPTTAWPKLPSTTFTWRVNDSGSRFGVVSGSNVAGST